MLLENKIQEYLGPLKKVANFLLLIIFVDYNQIMAQWYQISALVRWSCPKLCVLSVDEKRMFYILMIQGQELSFKMLQNKEIIN
jgi:hypothetical protein